MAEELKEAFKVFDRDQDGFISAIEVNFFTQIHRYIYMILYNITSEFVNSKLMWTDEFMNAVEKCNDKYGGKINR